MHLGDLPHSGTGLCRRLNESLPLVVALELIPAISLDVMFPCRLGYGRDMVVI